MPITVSCPTCQAQVNAPDSLAGKQAKCSNCGGLLRIPPLQPAAPDWLQDHVSDAGAPPPKPAARPPASTPTPAPVAPRPRRKPVEAESISEDPRPRRKVPEPETVSEDPGPRRKAAEAEADSPEPRPRRKAAEPESDSDTGETDSSKFDDLPGGVRARLKKEVGDEKVVWVGRADAEERLRQARLGPIFGIVLILLAPAALFLMRLESTPDSRWIMQAVAIGLTAILAAFGLPLLFLPLLVRMFVNYRPVYVLTQRRAIVYHNILVVMAKVWSYDRGALQHMEVKVGDNGLGDIVMGHEEYEHQGRLKHTEDTRTSEDGRRKVTTSTLERVGQHTSHIPVGFLDVADVLKVEKLIRRTLNLPKKAE